MHIIKNVVPCSFVLLTAARSFAQEPVSPVPPVENAAEQAPVEPPAPDAAPLPEPLSGTPEVGVVQPAPLAPTTEPETNEPTTPERLAVGKHGFWQPSALLQMWGFYSRQSVAGGDPVKQLTFRPRRAELRVKGDIIPDTIGYAVMIDPARVLDANSATITVQGQEPTPATPGTVTVTQPSSTAISALQDLFITFKSPVVDVSAGQFKIPVSYEGYNSTTKLIFPERALSSRQFGDRRDLGLRLEKKLGDAFYYSAGVFNGEGQNRLDGDEDKDLALRLELYPVAGLTLAAVGYTTVGERDRARDRLEGDLKYDDNGFIFQAEYIRAWDRSAAGAAAIEGQGGYAAAGYSFANLQPVLRVGFLDTDVDVDDNQIVQYDVALNYYIQKQETRLALSLSLFDPQGSGNNRFETILLAQVSF